MADVVSEGRRLLAEGTKRPWKWGEETLRGHDGNAVFYPRARDGLLAVDLLNRPEDGHLLAFAVNHLAALLDCADALRADLAEHDDALKAGGSGDFYASRAAAARLEGDTE